MWAAGRLPVAPVGRSGSRHARGFTLVEVLVALVVLAIALSAVIKTTTENVANAGRLRDKTFANWIASNKLSEIRALGDWPKTGFSNGDTQMAGRDWNWEMTVEKTADDDMRRIELAVIDPKDDTKYTTLVAFVTRKAEK